MAIDTHLLYQCKYCMKRFSKERFFMSHECTQMLRSREIQTVIGQQAYQIYKTWLDKQRRKPPPIETFCTSTYYTSMLKFAHWARDTSIGDIELYVELMVKRGISPALWTRSEAYKEYLEHLDKRSDPYEQAEATLNTLSGLAEKLNTPINSLFSTLKYGEVLQLVQQRRLSPWVLFCSKTFKDWTTKLDPQERAMLMQAIGIDYWAMKLEKFPDVVNDMKLITQGVGI